MTDKPAPYTPRPLPAPVVRDLNPSQHEALRASQRSLDNLLKGQ